VTTTDPVPTDAPPAEPVPIEPAPPVWTVWSAAAGRRGIVTGLRTGWADLKAARGLGWEFFRRDFSAKYRESYFGYVWALLPPVAAAFTMTLANRGGIIAGGGSGALPYPVLVLVGTALWQTFAEAVVGPVQAVNGAKPLLAKIRFPVEAVLIAKLWEIGLNVLIRVGLVAGALAVYGIPVSGWQLLAPVGVAGLVACGFALGLLLSPMAAIYNDVTHGLALGMGLWMFLSPVIYQSAKPGSAVAAVNAINPATPLVVSARDWITGVGSGDPVGFGLVTAGGLALLVAAWLVWRFAMTFVVERAGS
jgi:lipopolysaccharide transport system permease protein